MNEKEEDVMVNRSEARVELKSLLIDILYVWDDRGKVVTAML